MTPPTPVVPALCGLGLSPDQVAFWTATQESLAQTLTLPQRTTEEPLADWLPAVWAGFRDAHLAAEPLVAAGMSLGDVVAVDRVDPPRPGLMLVDTDIRLVNALRGLVTYTQVPLGVRDGVGWVLAACSAAANAEGSDLDGDDTPVTAADLVQAWAAVGLGQGGWVYAAAGLTPAEAAAGIGEGTLDVERARVMAALRGAVLPVG